MAQQKRESDVISSVEDVLTCLIHYGPVRQPKALPCGHSYCLSCLQTSYQLTVRKSATESNPPFTCPVCGSEADIPDGKVSNLRTDFKLVKLLDALKDLRHGRCPSLELRDAGYCGVCKAAANPTSIAKSFCTNLLCSKYLCDPCTKRHRNVFPDHKVVNLLSEEANDLFCSKHEDDLVRYYCLDCNVSLCMICLCLSHNAKHRIVDIVDKEQIFQSQKQITGLISPLEEQMRIAKELSIDVSHTHEDFNGIFATCESELSDAKSDAIRKVEELHNSLELERQRKKEDVKGVFRKLQENISTHYVNCESACEYAKQVLAKPESFKPLTPYKALIAQMTQLIQEFPVLPDSRHLKVVKFLPEREDLSLGTLEEVPYHKVMCKYHDCQSGASSDDLPMPRTLRSQSLSSSGGELIHPDTSGLSTTFEQYIKLKQFGGYRLPRSISETAYQRNPFQTNQIRGTTLHELRTSWIHEWTINQYRHYGEGIYFSDACFLPTGDLCVVDKKGYSLLMADGKSGTITNTFKFKKGIMVPTIKLYPFGVTSSADSKLLITDRHRGCVHIYDVNGAYTGRFGETCLKKPKGICLTSSGKVVVVDQRNCKLFIFNDMSGNLLQEINVCQSNPYVDSVWLPNLWYTTVDDKGRIYVTDTTGNGVFVYDMNGEYLFSFGGPGPKPDNLNFPQGLCVGPLGTLYVSDMHPMTETGRIVQFHHDGRYIGFDTPVDDPGTLATSSDNRSDVIVTSFTQNTISKFKLNNNH